jgi:TonB-linked SusC/RagA family outer membrane protein
MVAWCLLLYGLSLPAQSMPWQEYPYLLQVNQSPTPTTVSKPLKEVLLHLEKEYGVRINYTGNTILGIDTDLPAQKPATVSLLDYLNEFLIPLGLEAELASKAHYIIYRRTLQNTSQPVPTTRNQSNDGTKTTTHPLQQTPQHTVTGVVTDENGVVLPGVTVLIKGTRSGATTDEQGRFTLSIPEQARLVFSYIGFKTQELVPGKRRTLDIKMLTDVQSMKDFVVNGYQRLNKESYTGSAVVITGEELRRFNPQNILASIQAFDPSFRILENNFAGSNPNALPTINVRGATSMPTDDPKLLSRNDLAQITNLPMFIMDGFQVGIQTIYDIDANRIESITLLKDAAATSIYGSRASNGVVIIQTKQPKEGKLEVFYNYELNVTAPDLRAYDVLNATQKLEYEKLAGLYARSGVESADDLEKQYYAKRNEVLRGVNTYWLSQPLSTDLGHKHSIYVSGGTPSLRYGVDARYQTNNGVMKGSGRDRYSFANSLTYSLPNNKFLVRNNFTISQVQGRESNYGSFDKYVRMNPYFQKTDSLGNVLKEVGSWRFRNGQDGMSGDAVLAPVMNPMYEATLGSFDKTEYLEFMDALSAEYNPSAAWRIQGTISLTRRKQSADRFISPESNEFYFYSQADLKDRGKYYFTSQDYSQVDGNLTINYNKAFLNQHFLNFSLGTNIQASTLTEKGIVAEGFTNDKFSDISFARRYERDGSPNGYISENRLIGGFFSFNYTWDNRFLMDGTVRVDGSSKFGVESRMAPFWSYGIGWNLHKEAFLANSIFNQFRVKATTGLTGDISFPAYLSNTTYQYYTNDWYATGVGASFRAYGNDRLRWQRTQNVDLSLEMSLFRERLYISPRYYHKLTKDLLTDINVAPSTGFNQYKENLGEMVNKGFEIYFRANVLRGRDWSVNIHGNMGHNTNVITKISNALKSYNQKIDDLQKGDSSLRSIPLLRYQEGNSLNTIYAVRSLGIDPENGKELFLNADGTTTYVYDVRNTVAVGNETPLLDGYFGGNIVYKGFVLEFSFYTRLGGDVYNQTLIDRVENADPRYNVDARVLALRWKQPGDVRFFKDIADLTPTRASSRFVQQENRIELKSVHLSYEFNSNWTKRFKMRNPRLALNMNDMGYWSSIRQERGLYYQFARSFTFSFSTRF